MNQYPDRDLIGYGASPPRAEWPGQARLAVNFVLNYEEGAEYCVLNGDEHSETLLSDLSGLQPLKNARHLNIESCYEFGSRVGVWRIFEAFAERNVPLTVYAVGAALKINPAVAEVIRARDYDVVSHAWRWIDYQFVDEATEREHIRLCVEIIEQLTGSRPLGWYTGRPSLNTRRLVVEEGGFLYDCDAYNDDLPYWVVVDGKPHLIICHSLDTNDSRFTRAQGFDLADEWFTYMRDAFDWLYAEGARTPRLLTVALHCRLIGRPARMWALTRFLDHVLGHDDVWICKRIEVARHWYERHPFQDARGDL